MTPFIVAVTAIIISFAGVIYGYAQKNTKGILRSTCYTKRRLLGMVWAQGQWRVWIGATWPWLASDRSASCVMATSLWRRSRCVVCLPPMRQSRMHTSGSFVFGDASRQSARCFNQRSLISSWKGMARTKNALSAWARIRRIKHENSQRGPAMSEMQGGESA